MPRLPRRAWLAATTCALATACATSRPLGSTDVAREAPAPIASAYAWLPARNVASARTSASASAPVAASSTPCGGARVDLTAALLDARCGADDDKTAEGMSAASLVVRVKPASLRVRSGDWLDLDVELANVTDAPVRVVFRGTTESVFSDLLDGVLDGPGAAASASAKISAPPPAPRTTPGFWVRADDARGRNADAPGPGSMAVLGVLRSVEHVVRVELAPRGIATARVRWHAVGYDQDKPTPTARTSHPLVMAVPPKAPLAPGVYTLHVRTGLVDEAKAERALEITVTR